MSNINSSSNNSANITKVSEIVVLDSYSPEPFEATIDNRSGAQTYFNEQNEMFIVGVLSGDEMRKALQLPEELKEHGTPAKLDDIVEKTVSSAMKNKLNSIVNANNNARRAHYLKEERRLYAMYMNPSDEKMFNPGLYVERVNVLAKKHKIGGTQVAL